MKASRSLAIIISLFLLVFAVPGAFAKNKGKKGQNAVEKGGWYVVYGNQLTETEAAQGSVEPGISIYTGRYPGDRNKEAVKAWAELLIRKAIMRMEKKLGSTSVRDFGLEEQKKARKVTIRTIRRLLRTRQAGVSDVVVRGEVEFKAGVSQVIIEKKAWNQGIQTASTTTAFTPYVALRQKPVPPPITQTPLPPKYNQYPAHQNTSVPVQHLPPRRANPEEVLSALSLTNTARKLDRKRWEWTASIVGPPRFQRRIQSVTYFLHPSFTPSVHQGNSSQPGHPFTAVGWGVFELKAEVVLHSGARRTYRHMLQF